MYNIYGMSLLVPCLSDDKSPSLGCIGWFIICISIVITIGLLPVTIFMCIKVRFVDFP